MQDDEKRQRLTELEAKVMVPIHASILLFYPNANAVDMCRRVDMKRDLDHIDLR